MRTPYTMCFALLLGAGAASAAGCSSSPTEATTGSSQARVVASSQGTGTTTMHLTGTNTTTAGATPIDQTIEVTGATPTVVDLSLAPGTYSLSVDILSGTVTLGTSTAEAVLNADGTTQIALAAQSASASAAASTVQIGVDVAPQITGVTVQATTTATTTPMTQISIAATNPNSETLTYYWSGIGFDGSVKGTATMNIPTATITAATSPTLHVIVQDATGASTAADVTLSVGTTGVDGTIATGTSTADEGLQACLDTQAACNAKCAPGVALGTAGAVVDPACLTSCTSALLSCNAN